MQYVRSVNGTRIAYERSGDGPPLVLVHGRGSDHTRWAPVLPALEKRFTVYAVDRRGRGGSGDGKSYSLELEFADVAAVVDSIGGPVNLLGHSFGALCSMEAALRAKDLRALVLYEPAFPAGVPLYPPGARERMAALLEKGDREGILTLVYREMNGMPAQEFEAMRASPLWKLRLGLAHTLPREHGDADYRFQPERFRKLTAPVLFLTGSDTRPFFKAATDAAHKGIPGSSLAVMPGQQHVAMETAPEMFTRLVVEFIQGVR